MINARYKAALTLAVVLVLLAPTNQLPRLVCNMMKNIYVNMNCVDKESHPYCVSVLKRMTFQYRGKPNCDYKVCTSKKFEICSRNKACEAGTLPVNTAMCGSNQVCCYDPPDSCEDVRIPSLNNRPFPHKLGFDVVCDTISDGGGWTIIQRRFDGSETFDRVWNDYKKGFGNMNGEFWMGFDKILLLLARGPHEIRFEIQLTKGIRKFVQYNEFSIGRESEKYRLSLKRADRKKGSTADGSSIESHDGMAFSTRDVDNDICRCSCASGGRGGWWFRRCLMSNLNGDWGNRFLSRGPLWVTESGLTNPLVATRIKIRLRESK